MVLQVTGTQETLEANGQTSGIIVVGPVRISMIGNDGGGTSKIQFKDRNGDWKDVPGITTITVPTEVILGWPTGVRNEVRVDLAGSTNPDWDVLIQSAARG